MLGFTPEAYHLTWALTILFVVCLCFFLVCLGLRMIGVMREDIRKIYSAEFLHPAVMKLGEEVTDLKATCLSIYRYVQGENKEKHTM